MSNENVIIYPSNWISLTSSYLRNVFIGIELPQCDRYEWIEGYLHLLKLQSQWCHPMWEAVIEECTCYGWRTSSYITYSVIISQSRTQFNVSISRQGFVDRMQSVSFLNMITQLTKHWHKQEATICGQDTADVPWNLKCNFNGSCLKQNQVCILRVWLRSLLCIIKVKKCNLSSS